MSEKKFDMKKLLLWGAVILVAANSFWTVMQTRIVATSAETEQKLNALVSRVEKLEQASSGSEIEGKMTSLEGRIAELASKFDIGAKADEVRKKALYDQIKAIEQELKHLEER